MDIEKLKYPIGGFEKPEVIGQDLIDNWIADIEAFPTRLNDLVKELSVEEKNWKYRPEGWSIKQVVHHCADSHMNSLIRFKWTLTEDTPTIKAYFEDRWAELTDGLDDDLSSSLLFIEGLHRKWVKLLKSLKADDLASAFVHPEHGNRVSLKENIGIYAWHCNHHLAHIEQALKAKGAYN